MRLHRWILPALLALLALIASPAAAQTFPKLTGRVVDEAHLLSPEQAGALDAKLAALEVQSQRQMVVVTLPSLEGYEIEDYGYRLGRAWGIGDKQRNDGLLLIVAPTERKVRIEPGYGLEGIITDALSSVIIQREIVPRFKAGDYPGGIAAATDQIIAQLQLPEDEARKIAGNAKTKAKAPRFDMGTVIFLLIFFFFFVLPFIRAMRGGGRRYGSSPGVMIFPTGGWGGGSDWGGGGGGGGWGGGGGFSGGGGSFGGGGSSGDW